MNIALRAFWSNNPLPIQEKINKPDCIIDLSFGNVLTLTTGVRSVNNKTGDVVLNAIDVGADSVGAARHVYDELSPKVDALIDNKLDKIDYVQHFRGLFSSYSALKLALTQALDGDYAHIDTGVGFGRLCAIWDRDDQEWRIIEANISSNTDEMPEGSHNLYFQSERVRQTVLTGLPSQNATDILATDSLIIALAKLQAQLKKSGWNWVNIKDVGTLVAANGKQWIEEHFINGVGGIWFCIKDDVLYMKALFKILDNVNGTSYDLITFINDKYKVKFGANNAVVFKPSGTSLTDPSGNILNPLTFRVTKMADGRVVMVSQQSLLNTHIYSIPTTVIGFV